MTLTEVKLANPKFFSKDLGVFFLDETMWVEKEPTGHVLKVRSSAGTCPVYAIDPKTKQLSYLRHDHAVASNG